MRRQAEHVPHASPASGAAVRQLRRCATASATRRLPTPSGPAKIRLWGSAPRPMARASSAFWAPWPLISRNATALARILPLGIGGAVVGTIGRRRVLLRPEDAPPEPALLLRLVVLVGARGRRGRRRRRGGGIGRRHPALGQRRRALRHGLRPGSAAEQPAEAGQQAG